MRMSFQGEVGATLMIVLERLEQGRGDLKRLLDKILRSAGIPREDVWITYLYHCQPPEGVKPSKKDLNQCKQWLWKELRIVRPKYVLCLGKESTSLLLRRAIKLEEVAGRVQMMSYLPGGQTSVIGFDSLVKLHRGPIKQIYRLINILKGIQMTEVKFYKLAEPFGEFSNFYKRLVGVDGQEYPTVEHYFQSMKFTDLEHQRKVATAKGPSAAARLGRTPHPSYRKDWDTIKDGVMLRAVRAKFAQHRDLAELLLSTGSARIIEHSSNDSYWADGGDGTGRNQLGITLMIVRLELGGYGVV